MKWTKFAAVSVLVILAPQIYILLQGTCAAFVFPLKQTFAIQGKAPLGFIFILVDFIGSLSTSALTVLPSVLMIKRPKIIATVFSVTTITFLIVTYPTEPQNNPFILTIRIGEYIALIAAFFIASIVGAKMKKIASERFNQEDAPA